MENEITTLDKKAQDKENDLKKNRAPGYKSKDEFENYARSLREKT